VSTDIPEEDITFIFKVEKISSARNQRESRWQAGELIFSTLKMEAICSSETSVDTQRTARHCIPEECTLQTVKYFIARIWADYVALWKGER
jgi:hypothetical protein